MGRILTRRSPITAAGVLAATISAACAAGVNGPHLVPLRDVPRRPSYDTGWIQDYRAAAAVAMAVMERELGIPRLDEVTLHFLADRDALRFALIGEGRQPSFASETASLMDAISGYRRVYFNLAALERLSWPARVGLIAHELTHTLQYELAGGRRGTSEQWLREGFADWVASRVLESIGVVRREDFEARRAADYRAGADPLPALAEMVTFEAWMAALSTRAKAPPVFAKAFFAVEFLIERHGASRLIDYFARFADSDDRHGHFTAAFGESITAFEQALDERLARRR
jgi:hypothetical protein